MKLRSLLSPALVLCLSDCAAVLASWAVAFALRYITTNEHMPPERYLDVLPLLLVFPLLYFSLSLYPGTFLRRPEELKRLCIATSIGFMSFTFVTFLGKAAHDYSRIATLVAWVLAVFAVPLARHAVRRYSCRFIWWATPCVMFGSENRLRDLCEALVAAKALGARPVALVLDENAPLPDIASCLGPADTVIIERIPLADPAAARSALAAAAGRYPKAYAVASFDSADTGERRAWLDVIDRCFQRIIIIPDMAMGGRVWVMAVSIGKLSGFLLRQNLLDPRRMLMKRCLDVFLTLAGGVIAFPLLLALAVAVRLDSKGPVLFKHTRIGRGGKPFTVYKFRTMAVNAAELLEKHLAANPGARAEWEADQKLRNDPRVTRVGRFLRKTSLDELPQLINVLAGDMSLVGPRPIVADEIPKYGEDYEIYTRVRPGITGLWQISGRNDTAYAERVRLDHDYVCNWSVWLDILIIARTVPEVLRCSGAY